MTWTASEMRHSRPLDSVENWYSTVSKTGAPLGQENLCLKFGLKLSHNLPDLPSALQQAWVSIRYRYPKIAATHEGNNVLYDGATPESIQAWVKDTFICKPNESGKTLFPQLSAPSPQMLLYYLPDSSEIVFFTSHWRMDGIGALLFLSEFLSYLAEPQTEQIQWGKEATNLVASLDEALAMPEAVSTELDTAQNQALMNWGAHLPSINVLPPGTPAPSTTAEREEFVLQEALSSNIVAACKKYDLSLTSAMHAALIAATLALQDPSSEAKAYASWSAFSLRPFLPEQLRGAAYAVSCAHTGIPLVMTPTTFFDDASKIQEFYRIALASDEVVKGRRVFHNKLAFQLNQPLPPGMSAPADPALNSIGVVDKYIQSSYGEGGRRIEVKNFWLGNTVSDLNIWIHLWSFQGKITLSALHNRGVYPQVRIQALLNKIVDILCKELAVPRE